MLLFITLGFEENMNCSRKKPQKLDYTLRFKKVTTLELPCLLYLQSR